MALGSVALSVKGETMGEEMNLMELFDYQESDTIDLEYYWTPLIWSKMYWLDKADR